MAAAEARAVWQRAANRCFVQEDAKRAPKLACCQSSSSSSKPVDVEPTSEADGHDHPVSDFKPINRAPSNSDLPPDTRWWLQLQPTYGYKKGLTHEKLNALETEVEMLRAGIGNSTSKFGKDDLLKKDSPKINEYNTAEFSAEIHRRASNVSIRKEYEVRKQGVKAVYSKNTEEPESIDLGDSYEKPETNSLGCSDSNKASELGFDPESPWIRSEKTDPWWRVTDKNDLASFVAQKSLDHIQNCDLPPTQKMHVRRSPYYGLGGLNHDETLASSLNWKAQTGAVSKDQGSHDSGRAHDGQWAAVKERVQYEPDKSFRTSNLRRRYIHTQKESTKTQLSESDPSKAQLLAALQRSQTRAREAEKAAEQAYAEKEHVIKLFFRQASQLFAYRQWLQILQLESLYLQIKNNEQPISSLFPVPWIPLRAKKVRKKWEKRKRGTTQNVPRHDIGKFSVALALGLGLVGAGLLLGWTVGWMLPSF